MRFEINDKKRCELFINIFNNLKKFTDSISLTIDEEKLYIQGMDASHVCIYELSLDKSWFCVWNVEQSSEFGVCLNILNKILHTWSDKQSIIIYSEDSDKLDIEFTSDVKGNFKKFFQLPLMDIDTEHLCIPDTEYQADIEIESKKLKDIIDDLACFNDTINFKCDENELSIDANSSEGSMKVVITIDDIEMLAVEEDKIIESSFSIRYISEMCQFYKLSKNCTIHTSENIPIQIKYELDETSFMRFYLAPKINDD
jgi:proliferating cell nuclear antigen